jgi:carboxyl-terminal processing protease
VTGRLVAPGVGLLRIAAFEGDVAAAVKTRAQELHARGAESLVIDLRATAQGPIENGIAVARLFVASGTLAQRQARGQKPEPIVAVAGDGSLALPKVLLVSAGTSGPAEVFAAALAKNSATQIVGEPTLGRAGIQKLVKFSDGSGLFMTWARFLTPDGKPIHGEGLEPGTRVDEPDVEFGEPPPAEDPVLDKALELAGVQKAAA